MSRLYLWLRVVAVAAAIPLIAVCLAAATLWHALRGLARGPHSARIGVLRVPLRLWMNVLDWIKGLPVGYSYWEQYQAPGMLDQIEVHHDE